MNYFNSPQYRAVRRAVKEHLPEIIIIEKQDMFGVDAVGFAKNPNIATEKSFSMPYREFSVRNNHLLFGCAPADPFSWDELNELIYQTEKSTEETKQESYNKNTRAAIEKARELLDADLKIKKDEISGSIDFEIEKDGTVRQYRFDPAEHKNKHLIKLEGRDFEGCEQRKLFLLPSLLKFKLLRTLYPGLKPETVDIIAGIDTSTKDPEIPYEKSEYKELYAGFHLRPLDIVYDVYDIFRVGAYAKSPMRILKLTNGNVYAWRNTTDMLGRPIREVTEFEKYEGKKEEIISQYKSQLLDIFEATKLSPADAIPYINTRSDGAYVFKSVEEAIQSIRIDQLNDPLFSFKKKAERLVSYDADSELSIGFVSRSEKETIVIIKYRKYTIKLTIDVLKAEIIKRETLFKGNPTDKEPYRLSNTSEKIEKMIPQIKNSVGFKKLIFDQKEFLEFTKYQCKGEKVLSIYKVVDEDIYLTANFFDGKYELSGGTNETLKYIAEKLKTEI